MDNGNGRDTGSRMVKAVSVATTVASAVAGLAVLGWGLSGLLSGSSEEGDGNEKMMKAPGRPGETIRRADFEPNARQYFRHLRNKE